VTFTFTFTKQAVHVRRNTAARSRKHCYRDKAIIVTYSECLSVALGIQLAIRMRRIILSPMACPAVHYLSTLSNNNNNNNNNTARFYKKRRSY